MHSRFIGGNPEADIVKLKPIHAIIAVLLKFSVSIQSVPILQISKFDISDNVRLLKLELLNGKSSGVLALRGMNFFEFAFI